jgi:hypothetical protein
MSTRVTIEFFDSVKNGPIALGLFTPLMLALPYGGFDTVKLLVDAGAHVNAAEIRGMTPSCSRFLPTGRIHESFDCFAPRALM